MNLSQPTEVESGIIFSGSKQVLRKNGQSFYFASRLFPEKQLQQVSTLYSICRYIDDCADEHEITLARAKLARLNEVLRHVTGSSETNQEYSNDSEVWFANKIREVRQWGVHDKYLFDLVRGAQDDTQHVSPKSEHELYEYCYLVAGVVGVMMCSLIGVRDQKAYRFAVDLGIAMQLTNICRDILEDSKNGRVYLPELASLKPLASDKTLLTSVVSKYLDTAERFYKSGYQGLSYIPFRARVVILLAGEIYRHIGVKIRKNQFRVLEGRTILSPAEKTFVAIKSLRFLFTKRFWLRSLHQPVDGYVWNP